MSESYPSDWDSRRKKVYEQDNYECQNCGALGGPHGDSELHAHHIVPISNGGVHKLRNLTTVCKNCHNAIHGDSMAPTGKPGATAPSVDLEEVISSVLRDPGFEDIKETFQSPLIDKAIRHEMGDGAETNSGLVTLCAFFAKFFVAIAIVNKMAVLRISPSKSGSSH